MSDIVFITGGSGLLALNWALAKRSSFSIILGIHERMVNLEGVESRAINLDKVENIVQYFSKSPPKFVIHAAGFTDVDSCESLPQMAHYVNVKLASNIAQATYALGIKLVHISTDHLFKGDRSFATEESPVNPINVYGKTKAEAELAVLQSNPDALVVRTNFYGWGTTYRSSFSDKIIKSLRSGKDVTLFQDVFFTPISIACLTDVVHELVAQDAVGVFNVVGDERISKYDFGIKVADQFNLDRRKIIPSYMADNKHLVNRPYDMSLSNNKVKRLFGRGLGSVDQHLSVLCQQESLGLSNEVLSL